MASTFEHLDDVVSLYRDAFSGPPWCEVLLASEIKRRLEDHASRRGFAVFVHKSDMGIIDGAVWFDTPSLLELESERGAALARFADVTMQARGLSTLVWEREVVVRPSAQHRGLGTKLRTRMLAHIVKLHGSKALLLTRMRNDNLAILAIARRLQFVPTGITVEASHDPGLYHEYWFRVFRDASGRCLST